MAAACPFEALVNRIIAGSPQVPFGGGLRTMTVLRARRIATYRVQVRTARLVEAFAKAVSA